MRAVATALKKKKIKLKQAKLQANKEEKKKGKKIKREMQVNGCFNHYTVQTTGGCNNDNSCILLENFSAGESIGCVEKACVRMVRWVLES